MLSHAALEIGILAEPSGLSFQQLDGMILHGMGIPEPCDQRVLLRCRHPVPRLIATRASSCRVAAALGFVMRGNVLRPPGFATATSGLVSRSPRHQNVVAPTCVSVMQASCRSREQAQRTRAPFIRDEINNQERLSSMRTREAARMSRSVASRRVAKFRAVGCAAAASYCF